MRESGSVFSRRAESSVSSPSEGPAGRSTVARNRDRWVKIVIWGIVIAMILSFAVALLPALA
jgi:hypothetical protein